MADSWGKKEREKKKQQQKKEKEEKKKERKEHTRSQGLDGMMAYIDENGNLSDSPPDPAKIRETKLEDIEIGVRKQEELDPDDPVRQGIVTFFNESRGFGFIKDQHSREDVFVHVSALDELVRENDLVSYEIEMGPKGASAVRVKRSKPE